MGVRGWGAGGCLRGAGALRGGGGGRGPFTGNKRPLFDENALVLGGAHFHNPKEVHMGRPTRPWPLLFVFLLGW